MSERIPGRERALIVQLDFTGEEQTEQLAEVRLLARSAGASVCAVVAGRRDSPDAATFAGKGKVQEIAAEIAAHEADLVIFNHELSAGQERNLERALGCRVVDRTSLMLGKIVPFLLVGYVQIVVILILGRILFDVPIRGSIVTLLLMAFPFVVASLGLGLFFSTLVRTQAQAMQAGFLFIMPNILLSGFMFPRAAMPAPAQWLGLALPLTYFLDILRGILLKGSGLSALWPQYLALWGFAILIVTLSVRRFHKTLE